MPRSKPGLSNQAAAKNRKRLNKMRQQIVKDYPIQDKKSGKRFKTAEAARQYNVKQEIKSGQIKVKEVNRSQDRSTIRSTLKISNRLVRGRYRKGVTTKLADGTTLSMQGMTVSQVSALEKQTATAVRIAAQKKDKGKALFRQFGHGRNRQDDVNTTGTNLAETGGVLPEEKIMYTASELKKGVADGKQIPMVRNKKGEWVRRKSTSINYQKIEIDEPLPAHNFENMIGRKLTAQEKKQGFIKIYAGAATGAAGVGMIGTAYAETGGPVPKPNDPMAGIVAIGGDFFQGVRNTASDWTFGATESGGVPSLDVETKSQFGKVTEGAMEQAGNFVFNRPLFDEHSKAGTMPLDQAWGTASKFAAENPAMFAGEILGEAGFWAGTMGVGRAVWGVGRGVKLAKLNTGGWSGAGASQSGQYKTVGQGAKAGMKEAGAIMKKDPFGFTMGYSGMSIPGIGKKGKGLLRGKTEYSLGQVKGFSGQTNVGKLRKQKREFYDTLTFGKAKSFKSSTPRFDPFGRSKQASSIFALPSPHTVKAVAKKTRGSSGKWVKKGKKDTRKKLKTRADYLAHARKLRITKRQRKADKSLDDATDSWTRTFYSN